MAKKKKATEKTKEKAASPAAALDNIPVSGHPRAVDITIVRTEKAAKREDISRLAAAEISRPRDDLSGGQLRAAASLSVQRPRGKHDIILAGTAVMQSKIKAAQIIEHRGNIGILAVYVAEIGRSIVFDLKSFEAAYKNRIIRGA